MTKGLQSAARTSCPLTADKTHTCSLIGIFCQVHAPTENDQNPFAACGRQTLRGFFDTLGNPLRPKRRGFPVFCPKTRGQINQKPFSVKENSRMLPPSIYTGNKFEFDARRFAVTERAAPTRCRSTPVHDSLSAPPALPRSIFGCKFRKIGYDIGVWVCPEKEEEPLCHLRPQWKNISPR